MRKPQAVGTSRDGKRYKRWLDRFGAYRSPVTASTIESWIEQFHDKDRDLAARVLDVVEFFGQSQIHAAYREALQALEGWHKSPDKRKGKWRFAAMSGSAGESGDSMLYQFRLANGLDSKSYNRFFVSRSELVLEKLGPDDTAVLLDDFSGTGKQVCDAWVDPELAYSELLAGVGSVFLIVIAASKRAMKKIAAETAIRVVPAHELHDGDDIFSEKCKSFSDGDRERLLHYGRIAESSRPRGYGDCGFVVVFQHRTPNNSIPILHANHDQWTGLFPRHD